MPNWMKEYYLELLEEELYWENEIEEYFLDLEYYS